MIYKWLYSDNFYFKGTYLSSFKNLIYEHTRKIMTKIILILVFTGVYISSYSEFSNGKLNDTIKSFSGSVMKFLITV
jgi:hypothetical protein